jgi:hypothetical protein
MVRKIEPFDAIIRNMELFVAMVGRNGAFWTWSGRWGFLIQLSRRWSFLLQNGREEWSLLDMVKKMELFVAKWSGGMEPFGHGQEDGAF